MDMQSPEKYLEEFFHTRIPVTREMGIQVVAYDGDSLTLGAPLAPNVNDKGTAFGGSLYSVLVLAGWGLLHLKLREKGISADVMIHECDVTYSLPVRGDWEALGRLADAGGYDGFLAGFRERGRGKVQVEVRVMAGHRTAVRFSGSYAVIATS